MATSSKEWDAWRLEVFGDAWLVWHDGPDYRRLLQRSIADPGRVADMLAVGLSTHDALAASAVDYLVRAGHSPYGFEALLRGMLGVSSGTFRVRVAEALFALTNDPGMAEPIGQVLLDADTWSERMDAAIALGIFPATSQVIRLLSGGVADEHYLVRSHAAQSLLGLARAATTIEQVPDIWNLIRADHAPRSWRRAADKLGAPWRP